MDGLLLPPTGQQKEKQALIHLFYQSKNLLRWTNSELINKYFASGHNQSFFFF